MSDPNELDISHLRPRERHVLRLSSRLWRAGLGDRVKPAFELLEDPEQTPGTITEAMLAILEPAWQEVAERAKDGDVVLIEPTDGRQLVELSDEEVVRLYVRCGFDREYALTVIDVVQGRWGGPAVS